MDPLSLTRAAREEPDRPFLIADRRTWTLGDLAERAGTVRRRLEELELSSRGCVALRATNRFETIVTLLALIDEGRTVVPLHPRLTATESAALVADSAAEFVLDEQHVVDFASEGPSAAAPHVPGPGSILAMLYTSGTTGRPKGALLPRSAFIASAHASEQNLGWREDDRWLLCMPVCHVGGLSILTRCLIARRELVLLPRFDAGAVLESIVRDRATMLSVVPTMLAALLDADGTNVLARLRVVLVGGAACPFPLLEEAARRGIPALTTYGLTEACSQVTVQRLRRPLIAEHGSGVALPGTHVSILRDDGTQAAVDEIGRIQVRGPTLMRGYRGQPPLVDGFETGDLGSLDADGNLQVVSRRTDLIVTGGENVYPAEVEQVLLDVPGVKAALVFGSPDDRWGQIVSAALVCGAGWDERSLRVAVEQRLASHKRPRLVCFVDAIPVTSAGKPDRAGAARGLREQLREWPVRPAAG